MSIRKEFKIGEKRVLKKDKDGLIEKGLSSKEEERKVGEASQLFSSKKNENKKIDKTETNNKGRKLRQSNRIKSNRLNKETNDKYSSDKKNIKVNKNKSQTKIRNSKLIRNNSDDTNKLKTEKSNEKNIRMEKAKSSFSNISKRQENISKQKDQLSTTGVKKNKKFKATNSSSKEYNSNKSNETIINNKNKNFKNVEQNTVKKNSKLVFRELKETTQKNLKNEKDQKNKNIGIESTEKLNSISKLRHNLPSKGANKNNITSSSNSLKRNLSKKEKIHMENMKRASNKRKQKFSSSIKNKTESFASGVKEDLKKKIKKVAESITKKKVGFSMLAFLGMGAVVVGIIMASIFFIQNFENSVMATSYVASDENVTNADSLFQEEETKLIKDIADTEKNYPGYDGYEYNIDPIGHNPQMFTAYLTIKYKDYKLNEIKPYILDFFKEMYKLSRKSETRSNSNGDSITILITTLTTKDMEELILSKLDEEEKKIYEDLMKTKGNYMSLDQLYEDKDIDWKTRLTRPFGYYLENGNIEYSDGMVFIGDTNIKNLYEGIVSNIQQDGSKYNVTITNKNKPVKERFKVTYKGLTSVAVNKNQKLEKGDLLGKTGNTFTITVEKNGVKFNPYFYLFSPNDDIPQILIRHINGTGGNVVNPDINFSGQEIAFDEATTKKLFAEAQKYIGMPYVYGGSNPSTSFDCSGYICWVYTKSGVRNMPRTTAQGIYNKYTVPISPSEAKVGDLVFFQNTYNFHEKITHIGIYVGNGQMLHCGDPIGYANLNSSYWKSKFYGFGRPAI